ncbi:MAG TPA: GNAT family N-acetyltransferase [Solirubrobacteraceae bacterium]|jgi:predicted N-acetyltransferase YhbS|nr:GNAT family N-acetyltransferase [Solirubrobacteraceae bacterium]
MEFVEFGELTERHRIELEGDEVDPFDAAGVTLRFRGKERHIALSDGGALVASAGLTTATVVVQGQPFEVVGLGGVFVRADRRGEGLARRIVDEAFARASTIGPAFMALFCHDDRAGLYERLGFAAIGPAVEVEQPDGFAAMDQVMMWRAFEPGAPWPEGPVTLYGFPF